MKLVDINPLCLVLVATIALATLSSYAHAQCTNPDGTEGQIFYNSTHKVVQFCNGNNWVNTGGFANSGLPTTCDPGDTVTWNGTIWACTSGGAPELEPDPDTTPDALSFTDVTNAALNTLTSSNTVTITGIDTATPVSVSGDGSPQIRINGGSWVTSGTITNSQTLQVRLTSANAGNTTRTATVDVGGMTANWSVATPACSGVTVGGYCWYLSTAGQSCTQVCASRGGYNLATKDYAGSNGTNTNCSNVLDALGASGSIDTYCSNTCNTGCIWHTGGAKKRNTTETTAESAYANYRRACACNN